MKFETHCHTIYSKHRYWGADGINTPQQIVKAAKLKGLDGIAITDHNNVKGSLTGKKYGKSYGIKVITGTEIRTLDGDLIALDIKKDIPSMLPLKETIEKVHDLGGITITPHPFASYGLSKCLKEKARLTDAIEVFNSYRINYYNIKAMNFAKKIKAKKVAGSDAHYYLDVGNAGIICNGDPIDCIKKGKVKIFTSLAPKKHLAYWTIVKGYYFLKRRLL